MSSMELSSSSCAEIGVPVDLRQVYQGISVVASSMTSHRSYRMGKGGCTRSNTGASVFVSN